ncbi:DNA-directed RNA polymerase subunit delta [Paenibacillus psychroresistens]|uniref:Probable DNA-directed RNA polymerase subunit delta n=1 Tax=Paenibacillus psychroresistens TaxID=1778678 RepID=A0A6B8RTU7_9BACL|nr:DNA-directed RNA polymerase subunit delta [Paenibacillus psychroresistens]QGQ99234.1 DNA-directed RNA polymerase subunit delta [Paenibacillus psychroresistens]
MSNQYTLKIPADQAKEMPMVDLAFIVLKAANTPFYYRDLMLEIAKIKGFSDDQVMQVIAQLYTEINVDGRFACVGSNLWGLKRWYPIDNKADDAMGNSKRPRIINDEDDDEEDLFAEEEDTYVAEEEDFDSFDRDREELVVEEEEEEELFAEDELADGELGETDLEESEDELGGELEEDSDFEDDDSEEDEDDDEDDKK